VIRSIERALNLQAGELRLGAPLFAYLFLVMASYLVGRVVRDARHDAFLACLRAAPSAGGSLRDISRRL
jgi:hypothetical protein